MVDIHLAGTNLREWHLSDVFAPLLPVSAIHSQSFSADSFDSSLCSIHAKHSHVARNSSFVWDHVTVNRGDSIPEREVHGLPEKLPRARFQNIEVVENDSEGLFNSRFNQADVRHVGVAISCTVADVLTQQVELAKQSCRGVGAD